MGCGGAAVTTGADTVIDVHQVEGIINPVVVEYMTDSIRRAEEARAVAVIFQLDTPGGLVDSTREIVKALLNANVPTVVYVAPSGARAASAGTFITMAAHVAAMAPGTNIGAAHPVSGEGKDIEGDMRQKAENDLAAFARSIAEKRQRNAEWAEKAVRESVAVTEVEAREQRVIDMIAEDIPDLVQQLDGRQVTLVRDTVTLHTAGATVRVQQMTWRQRLLAALSHPQIALMLLSLGSIGLLVELYNPGLDFSRRRWGAGAVARFLFPANPTDQLYRAVAHWLRHGDVHPGNQGDQFWHAHPGWHCLHVSGSLDADRLPGRVPAHSRLHDCPRGWHHRGTVPVCGRCRSAQCGTQARERTGRYARRHWHSARSDRPHGHRLRARDPVERAECLPDRGR